MIGKPESGLTIMIWPALWPSFYKAQIWGRKQALQLIPISPKIFDLQFSLFCFSLSALLQ